VVRDWAAGLGFKAPTFLAVLLTGVLITNVADAARRPLDTEVTDLVGAIALRIFLAIAMLTLDWTELAEKLPMLLAGAAVQATVTVLIAVLVVYTLFGRDRAAAAAAAGSSASASGDAGRPGGDAGGSTPPSARRRARCSRSRSPRRSTPTPRTRSSSPRSSAGSG
jgi:sodium--glutamate symport carrier gltS